MSCLKIGRKKIVLVIVCYYSFKIGVLSKIIEISLKVFKLIKHCMFLIILMSSWTFEHKKKGVYKEMMNI